MRRYGVLAVVLAMAGALVLTSSSASAVDDLVIPVDSVARGEPGSILEIADIVVEDGLVGATCDVRVETDNNGSVHPDNDLLIETAGQTYEIPNVESEPGLVIVVEQQVVLGTDVLVELRFGPDGITSGGLSIRFDCTTPPPTTTAPPTTAPPTTVPEAQPAVVTPAQPSFTG